MSDVFRARAPGRVNLIGEHTDYNGGFVLPSAIPQQTEVTLVPRPGDDDEVHAGSANLGAPPAFRYRLGAEARAGAWWDYLQGVTFILRRDFPAAAARVRGMDLTIASRVPVGSGLSSSAALEIAFLRAAREAFGLGEQLDDVTLARIAQRAENDFVGARVGIMDPLAASLAETGRALFIDTRSLETRPIALPPGAELAVIGSGIAHRNASGGGYNTRRAECEQACQRLGVRELREVERADGAAFRALTEKLPEELQKRVRHVVTENARVLAAVRAMEAGDADALGRLFAESHASMRDDYEVSIPEIDQLVEIAARHPGVYGARLTGGGFGGSIVLLARAGQAADAAREIAGEYGAAVPNARAEVLVPLA